MDEIKIMTKSDDDDEHHEHDDDGDDEEDVDDDGESVGVGQQGQVWWRNQTGLNSLSIPNPLSAVAVVVELLCSYYN